MPILRLRETDLGLCVRRTGRSRDSRVLEAAFQVLVSATDCSDTVALKQSGGKTFGLVGHSGFPGGSFRDPPNHRKTNLMENVETCLITGNDQKRYNKASKMPPNTGKVSVCRDCCSSTAVLANETLHARQRGCGLSGWQLNGQLPQLPLDAKSGGKLFLLLYIHSDENCYRIT